jgi:uncharacterized protein
MTNSMTTSKERSISSARARGPVARALVRLVGLYQWLRAGRPSACRFYPTCSQYALEAITLHGAARGSWLALRRLGRCRPLGPHGIDLVPEPLEARSTSR